MKDKWESWMKSRIEENADMSFAVFGVWMKDLDLTHKLVSLWDDERSADKECRELQRLDPEVAYFVQRLAVKSRSLFDDFDEDDDEDYRKYVQ